MDDTIQAERLDAVRIQELAHRWGCSASTIRRKLRDGQLPRITLPGSTVVWIPTDAVIAAERPTVRTMDHTPQTLDAADLSSL